MEVSLFLILKIQELKKLIGACWANPSLYFRLEQGRAVGKWLCKQGLKAKMSLRASEGMNVHLYWRFGSKE